MNLARSILPLAAVALMSADALAQGRMGSIYNPDHGPISLPADKTARRVGDLLTIVISETQNVRNEEKTDLSKQSTLNYALLNFDVAPGAFDPLPSIATSKVDDFVGDAKVEKKRNFTARLTAIVMDTLPNGNLVVQGRREIRIDGETKVIEFSGVVRRYDVKRDNTVESELVADARVSFSGTGTVTRTVNRYGLSGWLHTALDWLWPF
jgi:flagellar L-ring protein precursor FlgH